jgi:hypothetical protein
MSIPLPKKARKKHRTFYLDPQKQKNPELENLKNPE